MPTVAMPSYVWKILAMVFVWILVVIDHIINRRFMMIRDTKYGCADHSLWEAIVSEDQSVPSCITQFAQSTRKMDDAHDWIAH